jgi:hypothetical protein
MAYRNIRHKISAPPGRVRKRGGGRKKKAFEDPTLAADLKKLVEPATRGDPMQPLLWTTRSLRRQPISCRHAVMIFHPRRESEARVQAMTNRVNPSRMIGFVESMN